MADSSKGRQKPPKKRSSFRIAIICALPLEADQVQLVFDRNWTEEDVSFGKAKNDDNIYVTGVIGRHNVVLAWMPGMGGNSAATVAASLHSSFTAIEFGFVVGVCGVVPYHPETGEEMILGDCVISTAVVQSDFGRQFPDRWVQKNAIEDVASRPSLQVRNLIASLRHGRRYQHITERHLHHLNKLTEKSSSTYPGSDKDCLYPSEYIHTHRTLTGKCAKCIDSSDICAEDCSTLGCEADNRIQRARLRDDKDLSPQPKIFFGRYGSTNTVLKSGSHRDMLSNASILSAFEMEGAGVWDKFPTMIIKAGCDYADSHKNKVWQSYAAASAAAALKGVLEMLELSDEPQTLEIINHPRVMMIPFIRDKHFVGRGDILAKLSSWTKEQASTYQCRTALIGMGGVGKSQIAIEFAYRLQASLPEAHVFWIHSSSRTRFEQAYREIASRVGLAISEESKALETAYQWLSDPQNGQWCLILDNLDDDKIFQEPVDAHRTLRDFLPTAAHGLILITSRSNTAAQNLVDASYIIDVEGMRIEEALTLLSSRLGTGDTDIEKATELVRALECLPLAITHAGAYIRFRGPSMSPTKYLGLFQNERNQNRLLSRTQLIDPRRDASSGRTIASTWQITFDAIYEHHPEAAKLLALMSMYDNQNIPRPLLYEQSNPESEEGLFGNDPKLELEPEADLDLDDNIAVLTNFSMVRMTGNESAYAIHRLVQLSMVEWLRKKSDLLKYKEAAFRNIFLLFPTERYKDWPRCRWLLPHAQKMIDHDINESNSKLAKFMQIGLTGSVAHYLSDHGAFLEAYQLYNRYCLFISTEFGAKDETSIAISRSLSDCLRGLGQFKEAEEILRTAIVDCEASGFQMVLFDCQQALANCLIDREQFEPAKAILDQCRKPATDLLGPSHAVTRNILRVTRRLKLAEKDDPAEAEKLAREIFEHDLQAYGPDDMRTLESQSYLAIALDDWQKLPEALAMLKDVHNNGGLPDQHPQTLMGKAGMALMSLSLDEEAQDAELITQGLSAMQKLLNGNAEAERSEILDYLDRVCEILQDQDRWSDATPLWRHVVSHRQKTLEPNAADLILATLSLGKNLMQCGQYTEAETLFRKTYEATIADPEVTEEDKISCIRWLVHSLRQADRTEDAIKCLRETLASTEDDTRLAISNKPMLMYEVAKVYYQEELWAEAGSYLERLLALYDQRNVPESDPKRLDLMSKLNTVLQHQNRTAEALPIMLRLLAAYDQQGCCDAEPEKTQILVDLQRYYTEESRWADAEPLLKRMLAVFCEEDNRPDSDQEVVDLLFDIERNLRKQARYAEAESFLRRLLAVYEEQKESDTDLRMLEILPLMVANLRRQSRHYEAETLLQQQLSILQGQVGNTRSDTDIRDTLSALGTCLSAQGRHDEAILYIQQALVMQQPDDDETTERETISIARRLHFELSNLDRLDEAEAVKVQYGLERRSRSLGNASHEDRLSLEERRSNWKLRFFGQRPFQVALNRFKMADSILVQSNRGAS